MTEDEADKRIETIFDEVKEVHVEMVNSKPRVTDEETIAQMDAHEMENACADLVHSWRRFKEIDDRPGAATDPNQEVEWWRRLDALGLADGSLKERFLGRDRSPASIRHYAKFRRKMVLGERYRTDA
jgi:hypothetical protein